MIRRWVCSVLCVVAAVACSGSKTDEPPPAPPPPVAELTNQAILALEQTPGSTPPLPDATEPPPATVAGIGGAPGPSPAYGPVDAPVRVYVLSDFQCPVCRRAVEPLKYLARRYPTDVRLVFKHNALTSHARAAAAAAAAIAAFRQGKFWPFADRLFQHQGAYDDAALAADAQALGLDVARFRTDAGDPAVTAQVQYESGIATSLELRSTPTLVVNGVVQQGWGSYMGMKSLVDRELARAKEIAAGGVPPARVAYEATRRSGPKGEQLAAALFPSPR
jgi:protein-disulfide isomerase